MNHPKREEWIPFLFGEADADARQRLESHLRDCPECAREVSAWRRTVGRLDAWKLPKAPHARNFSFKPVGLATAAAIIVGAFMIGRFSTPQLDAEKFRAELKSELGAEIQQGFAKASSDSAKALANLEYRLASASVHDSREMAQEFVQMINDLRSDDRKATEALFAKLEKQYTTDFVLLRRDLETLASTTDEEIENARLKFFQLASNQK
ncbi:MAG TPA: zf-HC2 domain-containing protein [Verrucomicrobiae bacterium]|jgi:hypothetical protein